MSVLENVKRILDEKGIDYRIFEHEPVYTSEQAARVRGVDVKTGVKAMVLKTEKGEYVMALVRADKRVDLDRISGLEGSPVKLAPPLEVLEVVGCEVGSVPPFGHETRLKTYLDRDILENEFVSFNCGEHTKSITMRADDLKKVVEGVLF